jgi:hypothetical protein
LLKVKNSKELSAPRPPIVVENEEDAEAVAVVVMVSVAETVNVVETANAEEVTVNTVAENSVVEIVLVENVVDVVKAVVVVDVARLDPELTLLKARKVLPLLNALNVEEKERDTKASPVKVLTPWTVMTVPDVVIAVTAKVELARAPGVMTRNPLLKVKPQLLLKVRQSPPLSTASTENASQESPANLVRDARDPLRKKRNPKPSSKKRRLVSLSMTTSTRRKPRTPVFSRRLKSAPTTRWTPRTSLTLRAVPISSLLEPAR